MTTLHMQSESVRDLAHGLEYRATELHYTLATLKTACGRLSWAWQGSNASRFRNDFNAWMRRFDEQIHVLNQLAVRVNREAEQWEFEDRDDKFGLSRLTIVQILPVERILPIWLLPQWKLLPPWFWRPPFWSWPPRIIMPWPRYPWPFPLPRFPWPFHPFPMPPIQIPRDWWPLPPLPLPRWPWFPPIDWWKPAPILPIVIPGIIALPLVPAIVSPFFPPKNGGRIRPPVFQPKPGPAQSAAPTARPVTVQTPPPAPDLTGQMEQAQNLHINQFDGDPSNADCGPTSLAIGLHLLGLKVPGEDAASSKIDVIGLARKSMVVDPAWDGVDASGARMDAEHGGNPASYTGFPELERGAKAAGAQTNPIGAYTESIRKSIDAGEKVIVSGTFSGKDPLPWNGDPGTKYATTAPGGADQHIIAVTGYDKATNNFIVNDPARNTVLAVTPTELARFMEGKNGGALALAKK